MHASVWQSGFIYKLLRAYLRTRYFSSRCELQYSTHRFISAGVPQGSKRDPILFNLYVKYTCKNSNTCISVGHFTWTTLPSQPDMRMSSTLKETSKGIWTWSRPGATNPQSNLTRQRQRQFTSVASEPLQSPFKDNQLISKGYLGIFLEFTLILGKHTGYAIQQFFKARNDIDPPLALK